MAMTLAQTGFSMGSPAQKPGLGYTQNITTSAGTISPGTTFSSGNVRFDYI